MITSKIKVSITLTLILLHCYRLVLLRVIGCANVVVVFLVDRLDLLTFLVVRFSLFVLQGVHSLEGGC